MQYQFELEDTCYRHSLASMKERCVRNEFKFFVEHMFDLIKLKFFRELGANELLTESEFREIYTKSISLHELGPVFRKLRPEMP